MSELAAIKLQDYSPSAWLVQHIELELSLDPIATKVNSKIHLYPTDNYSNFIKLDGENIVLDFIKINDKIYDDFKAYDSEIIINNLPKDNFILEISTIISPANNTELEGLYVSNNIFCTQCEAQGFRKISYYLDRPDILSTFTTTIIADRTQYPILLSNGNLQESKQLDNNLHSVTWHDPIPKPCYLFALVAGKLTEISDSFTTASGKEVDLKIFVESHNSHLCDYAMQSLKDSMAWDEAEYGREYDLNIFNIVAVDDFNMGAMENKSLNIFNSKFILADTNTATDDDFINIQAVVAHEYFHNWTGNRITCREWFQLSLKEGLTVFRDQEFTGCLHSKPVKRIQDVRFLKTTQFAEDSSPLAHAVRPNSYVEINNFYTLTIYEKGAEIIRMFYNLLGKEKWRLAMDIYFDTFDGKAVTVEDLLNCVSNAAQVDYSRMIDWYTQPGTPQVSANWEYDIQNSQWLLTINQQGHESLQQTYKNLLIPIATAWINPETGESTTTQTLELTKSQQTFVFNNVPINSVPSLLQNFSAPVELKASYNETELAVLIKHDTDKFNRWQALQTLFIRVLLDNASFNILISSLNDLLDETLQDPAWLAEMLDLPSINSVAEHMTILDIDLLNKSYPELLLKIAEQLKDKLLKLYLELPTTDDLKPKSMSLRKLKNNALLLLAKTKHLDIYDLAVEKYQNATNMTDKIASLSIISNSQHPQKDWLFSNFYNEYKNQNLVIDKWFSLQASANTADVFEKVVLLTEHKEFNWKNPNRMRSLLAAFTNNLLQFHRNDGKSYELIIEWIIKLDAHNPQISARLCKSFSTINRLDSKRQTLLRKHLNKFKQHNLSKDLTEIVNLLK